MVIFTSIDGEAQASWASIQHYKLCIQDTGTADRVKTCQFMFSVTLNVVKCQDPSLRSGQGSFAPFRMTTGRIAGAHCRHY